MKTKFLIRETLVLVLAVLVLVSFFSGSQTITSIAGVVAFAVGVLSGPMNVVGYVTELVEKDNKNGK